RHAVRDLAKASAGELRPQVLAGGTEVLSRSLEEVAHHLHAGGDLPGGVFEGREDRVFLLLSDDAFLYEGVEDGLDPVRLVLAQDGRRGHDDGRGDAGRDLRPERAERRRAEEPETSDAHDESERELPM